MKESCLAYFEAFSRQDLASLATMFADDVELVDWEIKAQSKPQVLAANQGIFASVEKISVHPLSIECVDSKCFCDIEISINHTETIRVLDVISFDEAGKIKSVSAFRQF